MACSKGGKRGLATASGSVVQGEIACGPALAPAENLPAREADLTSRLLLSQVGVLMQQEDKTAALDELVRSGLPPEDSVDSHQEILREPRTKGRQRAGHGGHPFRKGKKKPSICCLL
jgi:hypothetical protein